MAACDVCGNEYWMAFEVRTSTGDTYTFDSIECASQRIAPECEHCQCRILGHGVEVEGQFFCCAHCARAVSAGLGDQVRDTAGAHPG